MSSLKRLRNPIAYAFILLIRGYQKTLSPLLPTSCKYHPSCSQYAVEALKEYGVFRGSVLAAWRLLRCNPMSYGGFDPVENQTLFRDRSPRGPVCGITGRM